MQLVRCGAALAIVALVLTAYAAASASSTPKATRACLAKGGAKFEAPTIVNIYNYPEILHELYWVIGRNGNTTYNIDIMFTRDAAHASTLKRRLMTLALSAGFTKAEISPLLTQRGNVVWSRALGHPATTMQVALLNRCLAA